MKPNVLVKRLQYVLASFGLLALGACQVLPQQESITLYRLPAAKVASADAGRGDVSLLVRTPYGSGPVDSNRILVVPPQTTEISSYSGVRWQDTATVLWRNRLAQAFRADGRSGAVTIDPAMPGSRYELAGELNAFQVEHPENKPLVHLLFNALLIDSASGRSVASRAFEISEAVKGKQVPEVVAAFGLASDSLSTEVVNWALDEIQRHKPASLQR